MTEIAGRHDQARGGAGLRVDLRRRPTEIGHLRQQPADIDRIGGSQPVPRREGGIGESGLHQPLAIVEIAVHLQRLHRRGPAAQLARLEWGDPALWIEDPGAEVRPPFGRRPDRTTRVAGGRDEDGERLAEPGEAGGEEARAEILEGTGRAVEQLQRPHGRTRRIGHDNRHRKIERFGADRGEVGRERIAIEEWRQHRRGEGWQRESGVRH